MTSYYCLATGAGRSMDTPSGPSKINFLYVVRLVTSSLLTGIQWIVTHNDHEPVDVSGS